MSKSGKTVSKTSSDNGSDQKKSNTLVYRYKDVNFDNVEVSELNKEGSQPIAYINYNDTKRGDAKTKILMQSGKIKLTSHGIPALDKPDSKNKYYPDDSKREFIKIPLDPTQPACVDLTKHLEKVDAWAGSEEMKKKLFGKRASKYQYQPCIKTPKVEDDGDGDSDEESKAPKKTRKDKNGKEYPIVDYVKMKFNVIPSGKGRLNKTVLKRIEGTKKVSVKADTITDIANEIKFLSEIRFVFYYNKIWANKTPANGATMIAYGLGFKIMAIEYTPSVGKSVDPDEIEFMTDEEDEDDNKDEKASPSKKDKTTKPAKLDDEEQSASDQEEDQDKQEEEKQEEEKHSDEENHSDEEKKNKGKKKGSDTPGKKSKGKQVEEESDEEISPKKSSKKPSKKSKKAKIEDEEEEVIKPKKRSKSASKSK